VFFFAMIVDSTSPMPFPHTTLSRSFLLWYTADLTIESAVMGEVAVGLLRIPTAVPQAFMTLGIAALFVALIDALVLRLKGAEPGSEEHTPELQSREKLVCRSVSEKQ